MSQKVHRSMKSLLSHCNGRKKTTCALVMPNCLPSDVVVSMAPKSTVFQSGKFGTFFTGQKYHSKMFNYMYHKLMNTDKINSLKVAFIKGITKHVLFGSFNLLI